LILAQAHKRRWMVSWHWPSTTIQSSRIRWPQSIPGESSRQ
jgi:hypothetical protein